MTTDTQALLSAENQQVLLFTLAADSTDHPPERIAAYLGGSVGTLFQKRKCCGVCRNLEELRLSQRIVYLHRL